MRAKNAARNAFTSISMRLVEQVLAFAVRTVFIHYLSVEYLGINSLFANIINVLNLAELGIGTAINVALYAPLAKGEYGKIKSLMMLYKKAYSYIGIAVLIVGVSIIPLLPVLLKGDTDLVDIRIVYLLYVFKTVLSYWLFAYKRSLLEADQKGYYVSIISYSIVCTWKIVQIVLLILLRHAPELSFYVYCIGDACCSVISNLVISYVVDKRYPYIKEKNIAPLPTEEKKALFKNVFGVSLYKISATVNSSADSIIISAFLGTTILGLYSNYLMIATAVFSLVGLGFNSITSVVGNINVMETNEKKYDSFNLLHFMSSWIYGFCAIALWVLLTPFVTDIWLGKEYVLSELIVFALCMNYLVDGVMEAPIRFRNACGLYWQSRYRAIATVIVNVALSIVAVTVLNWGIPGVLLATIISRVCITLWVDTSLVHKYVFQRSPFPYIFKYFLTLLIILTTGAFVKWICSFIPERNLVCFALRVIICAVFPNLIWYLAFRRTNEFKFVANSVCGLFKRGKSERGKI